MARTRAGLLDAAVRVVAARGTRRAAMAEIAAVAGVAKGTLYNHFRTKDDIWSALVEFEVRRLAEECHALPLDAALTHAAGRLGAHPAVRRLAADEPAVLAALVGAGTGSGGWLAARAAVADALSRAGRDPDAADLVTRWLASHLTAPDAASAEGTARLLAASLPPARDTVPV
jgi:AcrR family transcriptional regulator